MNRFIVYSALLMAFILSGCITRVTQYEAERVDQELKGNRGIVRGKVPSVPETTKKKTKTMYNIEIELPARFDDKKTGTEDTSLKRGNKGYMKVKKMPVEKTSGLKTFDLSQTPQVVYQAPVGPENKYAKEKGSVTLIEQEKTERVYVVKKGDTLQKISKEIYGTTKKWKKIYEANKDVLKSPDLIKPGQKLVIPE